MYSVAHAVHHYALIGIIGGLLGVEMPPGFGVAPSTLKHQATLSGAQAVPARSGWVGQKHLERRDPVGPSQALRTGTVRAPLTTFAAR